MSLKGVRKCKLLRLINKLKYTVLVTHIYSFNFY